MAVEKLAIHQPKVVMPYFGLFESKNGSAIDSVLPMDSLVSEVIRGWMDAKCEKTAKFLFMIRLYLPAINGLTHRDVLAHHLKADKETMTTAEYIASAVVDDVNALHLQFVQAVYHVSALSALPAVFFLRPRTCPTRAFCEHLLYPCVQS